MRSTSALSPTSGYAFTDGVDLQLKAVDFATSLPKKECMEWLGFLNVQFNTNWLDGGGEHYHSKMKTGRPDAPEAQLNEFLPLLNPYHTNVKARMDRAAPVAEFRIAFPSMFSSDIVSLPGTSSAALLPHRACDTRRRQADGCKGDKKKKDGKRKGKAAAGDALGPWL